MWKIMCETYLGGGTFSESGTSTRELDRGRQRTKIGKATGRTSHVADVPYVRAQALLRKRGPSEKARTCREGRQHAESLWEARQR